MGLAYIRSGQLEYVTKPAMVDGEDGRTAVFGKSERTVGWEGNGDLTTSGLVRHCKGETRSNR